MPSDGTYITSVANDYTLCVWDSLNEKVARGPINFSDNHKVISDDDRNYNIALALDGRRVAFIGPNKPILLFDVRYKGDSDVVLYTSSVLAKYAQHYDSNFAFSQDGQYLATSSREDRTIKIWDLQATLKHKRALDDLASDDSEVIHD